MSEADLCRRLREWAESQGFVVYPEVSGWDLVFISAEGARLGGVQIGGGEQVGIHAKLRANCEVLVQACPPDVDAPGPHYRMVAVPRAGEAFRWVAAKLGIGVIVTDCDRRGRRLSVPVIDRRAGKRNLAQQPLPLPPIASRAIVAGSPSPRALTTWRVKALQFLAFARANDGKIRIADLIRHGLGRQWSQSWLVPNGVYELIPMPGGKPTRAMAYSLTRNPQALPDWGYEDVAAELAASSRLPAPPRT